MELLEQHFDTAFSAPDGIQKLRKLILTLAMQGKLVPQDPSDPPASNLLKEIGAEKKRLVKEGKIKAPKLLPPVTEKEKPYALPQRWQWVRLIEIGYWALGSGLPHSIQGETDQKILLCKVSDMNLPGNEKFIVSSNNSVSEETAKASKLSVSEPGTIIFPKIGGAIATNKRRILLKRTVIDNNCLGITPYSLVDLEWAYQLLLSFDFSKYQTGTSVPAISQGTIGEIVVGLPSAPEQHRIVAKIDQLMARCDALEKLRATQKAKRLAVHAAALSQLLDATDNGSTNDAWVFITQHFGELYAVKENVVELRKAILQLAMMGKLVPQDPNDPPASELLKEIEAEKKRLVKEGKIKAPKPLKPVTEEETPYALPHGWEWVRVRDVAQLITSGSRDWATYISDSGAIFVTMGNLSRGSYQLRMDNVRYVNPPASGEGSRTKLEENDLLISITGDVGNLGLIPPNFGDAYINQHTCLLRFMPSCRTRYFPELMRSPLAKLQFDEPQRGIKNSFRLSDVGEMLIPLPPLTEQHRIVEKIDQLMVLCGTLDQQITAATCKQSELLNAVMADV
ncbi:restriction endonuclease subunit S [Pollutimonas subterranea]|uniref:Restriction endonuclease subunit S n=1 Tax=Pollutimonas subterranea TaxID=2045210 RepID=A0A2N4TYS2_9BURK|nr:restriction endonuclease subunit S [Pollutimonas subterranea]PLC47920.1 restriction endonuclease subunit S [Pollutimonas subterranea]